MKRGDSVSFVRGADGAHQLRNETDAPARYLMISTLVDYEVGSTPDSGKVGFLSKDLRLLVRPESGVDYLDGED